MLSVHTYLICSKKIVRFAGFFKNKWRHLTYVQRCVLPSYDASGWDRCKKMVTRHFEPIDKKLPIEVCASPSNLLCLSSGPPEAEAYSKFTISVESTP